MGGIGSDGGAGSPGIGVAGGIIDGPAPEIPPACGWTGLAPGVGAVLVPTGPVFEGVGDGVIPIMFIAGIALAALPSATGVDVDESLHPHAQPPKINAAPKTRMLFML